MSIAAGGDGLGDTERVLEAILNLRAITVSMRSSMRRRHVNKRCSSNDTLVRCSRSLINGPKRHLRLGPY